MIVRTERASVIVSELQSRKKKKKKQIMRTREQCDKKVIAFWSSCCLQFGTFGDEQRPPGVPICPHIWTEIRLRLALHPKFSLNWTHRFQPKDGELEDEERCQEAAERSPKAT